eukprot:3537412-Rhodomonas_salina.1
MAGGGEACDPRVVPIGGDGDTYPTLTRTVVRDAALADSTVRMISSMGWTRIAIVYVDDAWGRGLFQDTATSAASLGVTVVQSALFELGDEAEIDDAIGQVARSGSRIIIVIVFVSDVEAVATSAERHGMMGQGYAWIIPNPISLLDVIAASADPQKTVERLTGWFLSVVDSLYGARGVLFQSQLESEPLSHLNHSIVEGVLTEAVLSSTCDQFCGTMYDAVWTAAIAMSRMD